MVKICCVYGCSKNKARWPALSFYLLPNRVTEPARRQAWLTAISRAQEEAPGRLWEPKSDYNYICSSHFISGAKHNSKDHPDYVPSVFPQWPSSGSPAKRKLDRYERAERKRKRGEKAHHRPRKPDEVKDVLDDPPDDDIAVPIEEEEEAVPVDDEEEAGPAPPGFQAPLQPTERESSILEMEALRRERDEARIKVQGLEDSLLASNLSSKSVENDDKKCKNMTGLSWCVFMQVFLFLKTFITAHAINKDSLPLQEQFFVVLVQLRQGLTFEFIATVKGMKKTTAIDYFWKWLDLMHAKLGFLVKFQDRNYIFQTIPPVFKNKFPRLTSIVDCFEIFIDAPRRLKARAQCWSNYKHHCTVKVFISCSPLGHINYVSKVYGGRASDVQVVRESNFMTYEFHMPGDQILADRGFTLQDEFAAACGVNLLLPSFTKGKRQLSAEEVETSRKISSVRIHIERVIGLLKNRYKILQGPISIQSLQKITDEADKKPLASIDKIVRVCAALINLGEGIVYRE
ncbi:uncharacterized protein LOC129271400 [Lytechinus pictus]|uniref:uncharacterized protein LOC129271400 n=1 Tax=Lytechinus pictus TaxID=7653 RepID=UPI0030B9B60C